MDQFKELSKDIFEELCKRDNIPVPKIVFAPCPSMNTTSCIQSELLDCKLTDNGLENCSHKGTVVYLNPYQYSLRTIIHEYNHYREAFKGNGTKAQSEEEAEKYAREVIANEFAHDIVSLDETCLPCALKHLLSSKINSEESLSTSDEKRKRDKTLYALAQLFEAENHLTREKPELAEKVREIRKKYESSKFVTQEMLKDIEALISMVDEKLLKEISITDKKDINNNNNNNITMIKEQGGAISSMFAGLYSATMIDRLTGISAEILNEINTPEIIGWLIDTLEDQYTTPFGHVLNNVIIGASLYAIQGLLANSIVTQDRIFLANLGSHFFWRIISLLNPATSSVVRAQAQEFGAAIASKNYNAALNKVFVNIPNISNATWQANPTIIRPSTPTVKPSTPTIRPSTPNIVSQAGIVDETPNLIVV